MKSSRHKRVSEAAPNGAIASHAIRVICVDDHAVLVEGLKAQFAINGRIEIVGQLPSAASLVEEVKRLRPHAVVLDIEMPGPDAFETAARLRQTCPDVRVIVLSAHVRDTFVTASFAAGISGYFTKSDEIEEIVNGIQEVVRQVKGSFLLSPKVRELCQTRPVPGAVRGRGRAGSRGKGEGAPETALASLTDRELEVLRLIGKGLSRQMIASQLCRSVKTIDGHQERMMAKLGIDERANLMRFAIREGLALP